MVLLSLSLSGGVGVVRAENCEVEGGTAGGDQGLVEMGLIEMGLIEMSDADRRMKEDVVEDGAVVFDVVDGRNLPLLSCCIVFASVAGVRLPRGR
jgi:hypothetical protein